MRVALGLVALCACGGDTKLTIRPPWPLGQTVALMAVDGSDVTDLQLLFDQDPITLRIEAGHTARLVAYAWPPAPAGPDLDARCHLEFGPGMPEPERRWTSDPLVEGPELHWRDGAESIPLNAVCPPRDTTCPGLTVEHLDVGPTYGPLFEVAPITATVAFAAGSNVSSADPTTLILRIEAGGGRVDRIEIPDVAQEASGLAFNGRGYAGATYRGDIFELDAAGRGRRVGNGGGRINHFNAHPNGIAFLQRTATITPQFLELKPDESLVPRPDFPPAVRQHVISGPDSVYVTTSAGEIFRGRNGAWTRELTRQPDPEFTAIAADDTVVFVAQRYGEVIWRDEQGTWRDIGRNLPDFPRGIATVAGGRAVLITEGGGIALWDRIRWCTIPTGTRRNFGGVGVAPDRHTVWAVGDQENGTPLVVRFTVP